MTFGFFVGSKNFCKLLWVSYEVLVLHGYDWIHWVAKSCTTTAYLWLLRDSQPSLRTLWSAVIKWPKFSARGTTLPVRLLHGALVILVLLQISQFRSSGNEYKHCVYPNPVPLFRWRVSQNVFRMESSHQTRDLECSADSSSIPWNPPTTFHPYLIATVPQKFRSLTLRTALSATAVVSDLCGVDVHWFQEKSSQDLPNSMELSV